MAEPMPDPWDLDPRLSCEMLRSILDAMPDGVYIVDTQGLIRSWNRGAERITGYPAGEVLGRPCGFLKGEGCPDCADVPGSCPLLRGEAVAGRRCRITGRDGRAIPILKNARPLSDPDGRTVGVVETITDLTPIEEAHARIEVLEDRIRERERFETLVGRHALMQEVYRRIELAAESAVTVLITGPSGTGKELAAQAIHDRSARARGPFVKVSCAALPETLLESELFGHVRGAFTGATADKVGRFQRAHGGTILLDEIGDLSPLIQTKLLRVLQERTFERVGESRPTRVDVRILTATHRDLAALVREGSFREDLFYRIAVFPLALPALRDRREDIPLLADHFRRQFNEETRKVVEGVSPQAMKRLLDHPWPGNVRQLRNAIEHAFVTVAGPVLNVADLPPEIRDPVAACPPPSTPPAPGDDAEPILAALERHRWNRTEAAKALGISRVTLWKRMKKLGIAQGPSGS